MNGWEVEPVFVNVTVIGVNIWHWPVPTLGVPVTVPEKLPPVRVIVHVTGTSWWPPEAPYA